MILMSRLEIDFLRPIIESQHDSEVTKILAQWNHDDWMIEQPVTLRCQSFNGLTFSVEYLTISFDFSDSGFRSMFWSILCSV
jgi:hypothetical protein